MKEQEVTYQMARITQFRALEKRRVEIYAALKAITEGQPDGPCGQGPFTGNTRESRKVESIHFRFSPTRGGAPSVEMRLSELHIEASAIGRALESMLRETLATISAEIEKL